MDSTQSEETSRTGAETGRQRHEVVTYTQDRVRDRGNSGRTVEKCAELGKVQMMKRLARMFVRDEPVRSAPDKQDNVGLDEMSELGPLVQSDRRRSGFLQGRAKSKARWRIPTIVSMVLPIAVLVIVGCLLMNRQRNLHKLNVAQAQLTGIHSHFDEATDHDEPFKSQLAHTPQNLQKIQSKPAQRQSSLLPEPLDYNFLYDANIPPAEKKVLWQKMKKHRSGR